MRIFMPRVGGRGRDRTGDPLLAMQSRTTTYHGSRIPGHISANISLLRKQR